MWRVAWQQARSSAGRLGAAAVAIILGSAFVAATLLAAATMEATTHRTVAAEYADSDLVITAQDRPEGLSLAEVEDLREVPGVAAADPSSFATAALDAGERSEWARFGPTPADERLSVSALAEGRWPTQDSQVAVDADLAARLGLDLGDDVTMTWEAPPDGAAGDPADEAATDPTQYPHPVRVVGLLDPPSSFFTMGHQILTDPATFATWWEQAGEVSGSHFFEASAVLDDDASAEQVRADIEAALPGTAVHTITERAEALTAMYTGDEDLVAGLGLAFAAVSLAVAALVIANTFTVLIAQRTATLALLRCVGASRAQIRRSVLIEAAVLGLVAAAIGLGLAVGVVALGLHLLGGANPDVPLDTGVHLSGSVVLTTLLTGVVVTVAAAAVPARLATRVAPLAALHPVEGTPERRAGRIRATLAGVGLVTGAGLLVGAAVLARSNDGAGDDSVVLLALGIGVLGGLLTLVALLLGAVWGVPGLIRLAARLLGRGVPARIAAANAVRNPRRTGATASALMIGVALVTMMSTGALIAQETLSRSLAERLSVDLTMDAGAGTPLPETYRQVLTGHEQVSDVALLHGTLGDLESDQAGTVSGLVVAGVAEGDLDRVLRDPEIGAQVPDDVVVLPRTLESWYGLADGEQVTLSSGGTEVNLQVHLSGIDGHLALVSDTVLAQLGPPGEVSAAWARFADGADEIRVVGEIEAALAEVQTGAPGDSLPSMGGSGVERAAYEQVINTLLLIVVALIGVSVVIALVGVANTLSLSVLERRRESAMLRALGLSRGQLRRMLGAEAVLISTSGALIGAVAGLGFGWAGATAALSGLGTVPLLVPWRDLGIVFVVALLAGLLASVLPARSAVRASPVAALAPS